MSCWKTHFTRWAMGLVGATTTLDAAAINVFAAASLTDSLKEIAAAYEKQTGDKVVFNFGASSFLARQIEEGAPAEVFFSADEAGMDGLEKKGPGGQGLPDRSGQELVHPLRIAPPHDQGDEVGQQEHGPRPGRPGQGRGRPPGRDRGRIGLLGVLLQGF